MSNKIGFIGCGKMAGAVIKGIIGSGFMQAQDIAGSEVNDEVAQQAAERLSIEVITDNKELAKKSNIIFLATKPHFIESVLNEIKDEIDSSKLILSIAAGVSTSKIESIIGKIPVIRVMSNTPALILEGMSATAKGSYATDEQEQFATELFSKIGKCINVTEDKIDIVTAISGSGPAFFYTIFDEIAKAGEQLGLDYQKSITLALQTAIGSANMIIQSNATPAELIQAVATKGGCTEVGVNYMKQADSEKLFAELIKKTTEKARSLA